MVRAGFLALSALLGLAVGSFAQQKEVKVALIGVVGEGEAASMASDLTQRLSQRLARAGAPGVAFVGAPAGKSPTGDETVNLPKVRELGRSVGADKVIVGKLLYSFAKPPPTTQHTEETKQPETDPAATDSTDPDPDLGDEKILRLRVMYAILDVSSGKVDHKDVVDYSDKVPEMFESMDSDQQRKSKAIDAALPGLENSIVKALRIHMASKI